MATRLTTFKNIKRTSFLIGDSAADGKDQIISESLGHAPASPYSFEELNVYKLRKAKDFADKNQMTNIRIVTTWWDGIGQRNVGIFSFKKRKETTKPFDFASVNCCCL